MPLPARALSLEHERVRDVRDWRSAATPLNALVLHLRYELDLRSEALQSPANDAAHIRLLHEVSLHEQMLAIALLRTETDTRGFFAHLTRSAEARRQLLMTARQGGRNGRFTGTSHLQPFCDALASGHDALARELARLSSRVWLQEEEYEEDFLYAHFLHLLVLEDFHPTAAHQALLDRWGRLESAPDARRAVCHALMSQDAEAFDAALEARGREHEAHCDELAALRLAPSAEARTLRLVFVEGLALLRLATARGLPTRREYRLMPALARVGG
ncbi:immunity 49 family protein [Corallococcus sp. M34]|uniref:Imm49 family immunity protein n=1 Tax=Citreicoccus inhibens TaxID=2849499 RepID=UPI001C221F61|nr:Imm49 family immunity protein [Citreicoccus inhibens]MBU8896803.1 immunity 49 family protein [Citreicoccus inhibens]